MDTRARPILVIGGGIAGMTAALEAAEFGHNVILVEKEPFLGGRVMRMHQYFPKMCPPSCGFEINVRRLKQNPRITTYTLATVEEISGDLDNLTARIKVRPKYVTADHLLDDAATEGITLERDNDVNYGMDKTKVLYGPAGPAYPTGRVLDLDGVSEADARQLAGSLPPGSIDLDMKAEELEVKVGAVVLATGWRPYDVTKLDNLGGGQYPNVITNVMMERLAAQDGPTGGEIIRPSDGKKAENVAFVQCAGSRDVVHLPYCSAVCCTASLKQVRFLREKNPDAKATIFYIDIRTVGRLEKFYYDMLDDDGVSFVKRKVGKISEVPDSGDLMLDVEDTVAGQGLHEQFDLVVLATGMEPNIPDTKLPVELNADQHGFADGGKGTDRLVVAGCAKRPCDVARTTRDATGAALKAIRCTVEGG